MGGRLRGGRGRLPPRLSTVRLAAPGLLVLASLILASAPSAVLHASRASDVAPTLSTSKGSSAGLAEAMARPSGPLSDARAAAAFTLGTAGVSPTALALTWTEENPFGFANYTIERSPNGSAGSWSSVTVIPNSPTTTSFTETQLAPSSTGWWEVVQNGGLFGGQTSSSIEVTQPAVSGLSFSTPTSTSVQFNWTNNATYGSGIVFDSYTVFERIGGSAPSEATVITAVATTTFTIQGLSSGTSYEFYVNTTDCMSACGNALDSLVTQSNAVTFGTPLPLVASMTAERSSIDSGQADLITCSPSGGESPFSFVWDLGNGTFEPAGPTVSVSYPIPGPESITCQLTDHAGTEATASTAVAVDAPPFLQVETNRSDADVGQTIGYTCSSTNGTAPVLLAWSFGDGAQTSGGLVEHAYSTASAFLASCTAVDGTGTVVQASTTEIITPDVAVDAGVSAPVAAPGTPVLFTATPRNGSGEFTNFTWSLGDGAAGFLPTVTHAFSLPSTYTARVSVTDSNGGRAITSVSVSIRAIQAHLAALAATALVGRSVEYSAAPDGGAGGPYNITWKFGDGAVAYGPNVSHNFSTSGIYLGSVIVADSLGANNSTALSAITVSTPPVPGPWFTTIDAVVLLAVVALLAGIVLVVARRRRTEAALDRVQGRIPPTDPNEVTKGAKVCRNCGTSNLPLRKTCVSCGRPLRRSPLS